MARPKKKLKRDRQFNVGLTEREYEALLARAARAACVPWTMAVRGYSQNGASPHGTPPGRRILIPSFMAQLSRLGNNLNQLARRLNTFPQPAPPSLEPLLREFAHCSGRARMIP